jgi:hypothetical protein
VRRSTAIRVDADDREHGAGGLLVFGDLRYYIGRIVGGFVGGGFVGRDLRIAGVGHTNKPPRGSPTIGSADPPLAHHAVAGTGPRA